ncbi:hypothetical protein [Cupriavidus numazuensis]|uniref:Uncharacterized protein n=1 Tax=Cupriavidus numazuensis TaxID=221992 RepID=A0ABM8TA07_9BURK|nr:hypothetical protein [Cupriavidus numazuensis]CAG2129292.1 hypothetical protein LMG26411_00151 [Cupriavidus numazuensis]
MIAFRITVDGGRTYVGLFHCSCDAINDGLDRGARRVSATPLSRLQA